MSLPRSFVQFALNFFEKILRDVREVRALGDILTDESVGVFVGSSLPGMVRPGEEEPHTVLPVNDFRPFGDVYPVRDRTPPLSQGSALLVPSTTMTQVLV